MRNFFTLLLLCTLTLSINSCKKSGSNPTTYTISGLSDVELAQGGTDALTLSIKNTGTYQDQVSLGVDGLPAGVSVRFSTMSGTPTFNTTLTFSNTSAVVGTYSCRLIVSQGTSKKYYDFTLEITKTPACGLPGTYHYTQTCAMNAGDDLVDAFSGGKSIRFTNFGAHGWVVFADVSCANGTIEVPLQSVGGNMQVGGNGFFHADGTVTVNYTVYTTVGTITTSSDCSFTMLHYY
jgi:hypothetical protein